MSNMDQLASAYLTNQHIPTKFTLESALKKSPEKIPPQKDDGLFQQKLKQAAQQLEAVQIKSLLNELKIAGDGEEGLFENSLSQDFYRDLFAEQLAQKISEAGGFGLSEMILSQQPLSNKD